MKATVYIFGNFADGYSQYPDNYTRGLFTPIFKARKSATELVYHRESSLTYYIYTREISHSANTFIGLCYVFNGVLITDFSRLFDIFEDTITNMVVKGELLEFTNNGNLTTKITQLYTHTEELQRVSDYMNNLLSSLGRYVEKLPPANLSISNTEWKTFAFEEIAEVHNVVRDYSNIRILKGENYDTDSLKGYAHKLRMQNDEIKALTDVISKQKDNISKLNRQKKQIKWVLLMLILIIVGGVLFYFYAHNKTKIIHNKSLEIDNLNNTIQNKNDYIKLLKKDSIRLNNQYDTVKNKLMEVHNEFENIIPSYIYFDSWTSTNYKQQNSRSQIVYSFYAYEEDELQIPYFVSSERNNDYLIISLKRNGEAKKQLVKESGVYSGTYNYTFPESGSYQLFVTYSKDGSVDKYEDKAGVYQIQIYRPKVNKLCEMTNY